MAWNRTVHYTLDRDVSENFDDDVNKATKESISFFETGDNSGSAFFVGQLGVTDATSYIELPVGGTASFEDQEFSFSMWVKPMILQHPAETYKWLVTKHNTGAGWHLKMDLDGVLTFEEYGSSSNAPIRQTITTETLTIDSWNHLAVVVQQDRVTIYVNGTAEKNLTARSEDIDYTNTVAYIGRRVGGNQHTLGGNSFRGYIDDFHYYDDLWDASSASSMYLSGRPDNNNPVELAYFPLDSDAQDSVGDHHATTNDITFSDGTAEFDGTTGAVLGDTSYVEISNPSNFHLQSYSVSFWYNPTDVSMGAGRGKRWLVSVLGNAGGSSISGWSLYFVSNRQLTYQEHSSGGGMRQCIPSSNAAKAKLNTWKHVALSVSPWFIRIYVDGNLVRQTMTPRSWLINWGTATAWLGRVYDNSGAGGAGDAFAGYMDDVKFYSGTLNSDDVETIYNAGRPAYSIDDPVLFNETLASDAGENGSISGVTFDGVANFTAVGNAGTDSITIAEGSGITSGLAGTTDFSISMWVKANIESPNELDENIPLIDNTQYIADTQEIRDETVQLFLTPLGDLYFRMYRIDTSGVMPDGRLALAVSTTSSTDKVTLDGSQWDHIFITAGNERLRIYLNGVEIQNQSGWDVADNYLFDNALTLGNSISGGTAFNGKMSQVMFLSEATSAELVQEYYNEGSAVTQVYEVNQAATTVLFNETFATDAGDNATVSGVTFDGVANFSNPTDAITITGGNGVGSTLNDDNGSYSISMWIKADVDGSSGQVPLLTDFDQSEGGSFTLSVATNGDISVSSDGTFGVNQVMDSNTGVDVDGSAWNHIFISADNAADNFELYVNNVQKLDLQGTWIGGGFAADNAITLGNTTDPNFQYLVPFQGKMALVKIWDQASTQAEIAEYYNEGNGTLQVYEANQAESDADNLLDGMEDTDMNGVVPDHTYQWLLQSDIDETSNATTSGQSGAASLDFVEDTDLNRSVVEFLGDDRNFYISNTVISDIDTEYTLSLWLKPDSYPAGTGNIQLFSDWVPDQTYPTINGYLNHDGTVTIRQHATNSTSAVYTSTTASLPTNQWSHLTLSWSSSDAEFNGLSVYLNGTLDIRNPAADQPPWNAVQPMLFGASQASDGTFYNQYVGRMADLRFWYTKLTDAQVTALYNNGVETPEVTDTLTEGLIAYFPLNNENESIGGHVGVLGHNDVATGNASFVDNSGYRYLEISERGQGLTFTDTGLLEDLAYTKSHSISAWVKIPEYVTNATRINYFGNDAASIFCKGTLTGGGNVLSMALENGYPHLWHRKPEHGASTQATVQVQLNTWTHLLVTIEGGYDNVNPGIVRWYVDGQPAGEGSQHPGGWFGVTEAESANQDIVIGGAPVTNAWPAMRFLGDIDDIRVWDRVVTVEEAARLHSEGRALAPVSVFTSIIGRKEAATDYAFPTPDPHGGWVFITNFGNAFESGSGDQVLSGPVAIPGGGSSLTAPESLIRVGGFWFALVSGNTDVGSQFQANNRVSYANAIDANGNPCFPSENGWANIADAQTGVGWSRALYSDGQNAYMTVVNDETTTGDFESRLYIASEAADNTSVPTWNQLNSAAPWNGQSITGSMTDTDGNSVSAALSVRKGAAYMTKHVWVCKDQALNNSFGCTKIVIYDFNDGITIMNTTLASVPNVSELQIPHYCSQSSSWFVPCRGGILKSTDGGLNWTKVEARIDESLDDGSVVFNDAVTVASIDSGTNGTLIAVGSCASTDQTEYGVIIRSEDDGETWTVAALNAYKLVSVAVAGEGIWVVGGESNLLGASLDDGYVWVDLDYVDENNASDQTISAIHYGGLF